MVRATSSMFSVSSVPKPVLRRINDGALETARLYRSTLSVSRR